MKKALTIILVVVAVLLITAYLLPSKVKVERSTDINNDAAIVFNQVNNLPAWETWGPWFAIEPEMGSTYSDTVEGINARHCWDSENPEVGKGCLTIIGSEPHSLIKTQLDFDGQNPGYGIWTFNETEGVTSVSWAMEMDMGMNPLGRVMGLFMDGMVGPNFEDGLSKLKEICEAMPKPKEYPIIIEAMEIESQPIYSIKDSASTFDLGAKFGALFGEIGAHIAATNAEIVGQPITIWHKYDPGNVHIFEAAIPVAVTGDGAGRVVANAIKEGTVVRGIHLGSYDDAAASYEAMDEYLIDNGYTETGPPWEQYISDPGNEPDTSKWVTHIYFRVAK